MKPHVQVIVTLIRFSPKLAPSRDIGKNRAESYAVPFDTHSFLDAGYDFRREDMRREYPSLRESKE
jgi:hypothetical protein